MVGFENKGEKNEQLKRELAELACGPYNSATKEVASITNQLIQSQKMVQNASATLRKVSNELFSLEESIHSIKNNKNFLITDFVTKSDPSKDTQVLPDSVCSSDTQVLPDSLCSSAKFVFLGQLATGKF
jgi:hypothetical protein